MYIGDIMLGKSDKAAKAAATRQRNRAQKTKFAMWALCDSIALAISLIDRWAEQSTVELARAVAACFDREGVTWDVFTELDDHPGRTGYRINGREWHFKLRQVRNQREAFDILHDVVMRRQAETLAPKKRKGGKA